MPSRICPLFSWEALRKLCRHAGAHPLGYTLPGSALQAEMPNGRLGRCRMIAHSGSQSQDPSVVDSAAPVSSRTVRSTLDHGDEHWPQPAGLGGPCWGLHYFCRLCCSDGCHPARHGGPLCFPARPTAALVRRDIPIRVRVAGAMEQFGLCSQLTGFKSCPVVPHE